MFSISTTGVSYCVNESSDEQNNCQDKSWEWENKGAEADGKGKLNGVFREVVKRPISSVVVAFVSLGCKNNSALRAVFSSILVDEHVGSQVTAGASHDSVLIPHWVEVKDSHKVCEEESGEISPLKIKLVDESNSFIIFGCVSFLVDSKGDACSNSDEDPRT